MKYLIALIIIITIGACHTSKVPSSDVIEAEFLRDYNGLYDAYAAGDMKWLAYYLPEVINLNNKGTYTEGNEKMRPNWEKTYEKYHVVLINRTEPKLIISPYQVVAFNDYSEYFISKATNDTFPVEGTYISVWQRQKDGTWKISMDTYHEAQPEK